MRNPSSIAALLAVVLCGPVAADPNTASTWTIPGTVNAGGLNNTRFVSDLAVTNPGTVPVQATISFIPAGGTTPKQVTLTAGQTVAYRNVLDSLWGVQGAGATQVASESPLLIRARTYNVSQTGTYGVALPVFAEDRLLTPGKTADSLWISQSADGSSGYRTNVAVVFPDAGGGAARVTIYDADGNEAGSQDFSLDSAGFQQFGAGGFAGAIPVARAQVRVTRGRAAGYSVVVDNVTGDSSLFTFEDLPAGYQDVVTNGVARANGRNNTFFRTDGRFYNPTDEAATVKVSFHAAGSSNSSPASGSFTVGAGRILDVVDLLGALLQLPVGSAGALRFETDAPLAILCRTSNVDPLGVRPGTFGAQQRPTPLLSFIMSADAGAVVTGIRQNAAFRTNVGFAAGADGANYALTLKSAAGATVATGTGSLGAFGWAQPNVQDLFPNVTVPDDATLLVRVTSGSVDVFDSSIDNASGDPVVTPIMPLPVNIPSSTSIGPQGGAVRSDDGRITLKVPAGALAASMTVALTPEDSGMAGALGPAYALTPATLPLGKPALLVFRAAGGPAPPMGLVTVSLAVKTDSGAFVATGGRVDPAAGTLTVTISPTSPSGALARKAGGRDSLKSGQTIYVPLSNMAFVPETPTVLTDGRAQITLILKFPPSAGGATPDFKIFPLPGDEQATITWRRPALGRIDVTTGPKVTYTAPHRIEGVLFGYGWNFTDMPVTIRNSRLGSAVLRIDLNVRVVIIRRDWKIESELVIVSTCDNGLDYQLNWTSKETTPFTIADDGQIERSGVQVASGTAPKWGHCSNCSGIIGAGADEFSQVATKFLSASFDFDTHVIDIFAQSDYTRAGATLTGCQMDGGVVFSQVIDGQLGHAFIEDPCEVVTTPESQWFQLGGGSGGKTATYRYRFVSVDVP